MLAGIYYGAQIRRLDHLDPAQHPGRSRLGRHLHRRPRDGAERPRRARARHRRDRLVRRRDGRHHLCSRWWRRRSRFRAAVLVAGILRADGARSRAGGPAVGDVADPDAADGGCSSGCCSASIGTDLLPAQARFIFGQSELLGRHRISSSVAIGVFGIAEVLASIDAGDKAHILRCRRAAQSAADPGGSSRHAASPSSTARCSDS